ncbi:hypothetical protein D3C71_1372510 [compost metagenome]
MVDGRAQPDAEAGARHRPRGQRRHGAAGADHQQALRGQGAKAQVDRAGKKRRQRNHLHLRTDQGIGRGNQHEAQADREQHLLEFLSAVQVAQHERFEQTTQQRRRQDRGGHRQPEAPLRLACEQGRAVATDHGEGTVAEVHEPHQAQRHRQADRNDEQHHAVGQPVDEDVE